MIKYASLLILLLYSTVTTSQTIDDSFSTNNMKKDLEAFKQIRLQVNSGLYKYRTEKEMDSIYNWAESRIEEISTYREFFNIINTLTDFEGSLHNDTSLPKKYRQNLIAEDQGYFSYAIKWVDGKWRMNQSNQEIPLGSEIISINGEEMSTVIQNLNKYYYTDGINTTGKRIGLNSVFSRYYRYHYGLVDKFQIIYTTPEGDSVNTITIPSGSYVDQVRSFRKRHSLPSDKNFYSEVDEDYNYEQIDVKTGLLTINTFSIEENEEDKIHLIYSRWLDSVFTEIKANQLENLIVDIRNIAGGTDPNDVVTYSYLTDREFQESKEVWISFQKVPLLKYYNSSIPTFLRPLGVGKYNRRFRKRFPNERDGKYFISKETNEMEVRKPNDKAFHGNIYLLISPRVASAGSLFAAMVAGNENTISIGEETMGGYYGHNGHTPMSYVLPKSKLVIDLFVENITQDVIPKSNQYHNRGVIPDFVVPQSFEDFMDNKDTQMKYVLGLIEKS